MWEGEVWGVVGNLWESDPGRCRGIVGELSGNCRGVVGELSGSCRGVVGEVSGSCRGLVGAARDQVSFYFSFTGPFGTTC